MKQWNLQYYGQCANHGVWENERTERKTLTLAREWFWHILLSVSLAANKGAKEK
jgi:hypothetical protein